MRLKPMIRMATCLLALGLTVGCQPRISLVEVEGTLVLDGQPLPDVLVTFVPEEKMSGGPIRSMGMTDSTGKFSLRAETQTPGAVIGEHRVIVEDLAILNAPRTEDGTLISLPALRFPSLYSDPLKTPLRATVPAEETPLELHLQSTP